MVRISKLSRPIPRWFTFRPMIPGWFTAIQSWPGRDGIRTRESGLAVRIFRSVSASESAGFGGFGWGWGHWGFDWHNHYALYDHGRYYSHSRTFYNRGNFGRGGFERGPAFHGGVGARPFEGNRQAARGYAAPRGESGVRSGAFSGYDHGGESRSYASRGRSS